MGRVVGTLPLTRSECATIMLLGQDLSQKAIADALGITVSTVNTFVQRVYRRLGVRGPAAAALLHRDVHPWCGSRVEFAPILERIKTTQQALVANDMTRPTRRTQQAPRRPVIVRRSSGHMDRDLSDGHHGRGEDVGGRRALKVAG